MWKRLSTDDSCLVVIDVQGKLAKLMHESKKLFENIRILIKAFDILDIPVIWCQQSPGSVGVTIKSIACLLEKNTKPVNKAVFSCCGNEEFNEKLEKLNRNQVILCGIESHICVYQTACELKNQGKNVTVIADAVSSRDIENKNIALERLRQEDVNLSSTEMAIFELTRSAEHPDFRQLAKLIK
jgi:nicotinamidase-related amidase